MSPVALLLCLLGAASALPQFGRPVPTLTARTQQFDDAGQFTLSVVQSDGQAHQEQGVLKATADNDYVLVKAGQYQYTSPEGVPVLIRYTADENGFHPIGDVIPVAGGPLPPTFQ